MVKSKNKGRKEGKLHKVKEGKLEVRTGADSSPVQSRPVPLRDLPQLHRRLFCPGLAACPQQLTCSLPGPPSTPAIASRQPQNSSHGRERQAGRETHQQQTCCVCSGQLEEEEEEEEGQASNLSSHATLACREREREGIESPCL